MFSKCAINLSRKVAGSHLRLARNIQSTADSYLHNPGSEPLVHATLGDVIAESVNKHPNKVAVKSLYENVTLTYEQLLKQADALGCAFRAQGLEKGDRVGIWSHNTSAWIVALIAAARVGLIAVAINPVYEKDELSFCIKKTGMKSLVIGEQLVNRDYYNVLRQLIPDIVSSKQGTIQSDAFPTLNSIVTTGKDKLPGTINIDSLLSNYNGSEATKYGSEVKPEEGCIIHFTSGTTGDPKAALDSHYGVVNNTYFTGKRNTYNEDRRICLQVPLFHALGSVITVLGAFRHGSTVVLATPTYNVSANIDSLVSEKCTAITGTPTMYVDMLTEIRNRGGEIPSSLRVAMAAGAPCSPQLIRDIQKNLKAHTVSGLYGMTEATASVFQSLPDDEINMVAETVGYIQDHVEVKVVDEEGRPVPFGSAGELLSRGYNNMICYWDEPEKTRQTIDADGWLSTGDKFTVGTDGYGRIVGRLKDIIVRGGENIAPKEIEDVLNTHPDIIESQVVGVSDERLGEELCAVLRVRDGVSITTKDVSQHLTGKLARYKIPRLLKLTDVFPKTASGKIQKYKLKELVEAGKV